MFRRAVAGASRRLAALRRRLTKRGHSQLPSLQPSVQKPVKEEFVLEKCDYFVDVQLWPLESKLDPRVWLENFTPEERPYAVQLLNAFLYFSAELTDALLVGAISDLSRRFVRFDVPFARAQAQWTDFLDSMLVTYPTGEDPNVTDSGFAFARKARQVLGVAEQRILSPDESLEQLTRVGSRPVLFVDDFLGSGSQFVTTWFRDYETSAGPLSFADALGGRGDLAFYVPLVAATAGVTHVETHAPSVTVAAAHTLPATYSALHEHSVVWPEETKAAGQEMIRAASQRAGIPDTDGVATNDWQGFRKLGLSVAFEHGIPDATLPLFYWEQNDWQPLLRRA